jgi:hypothetical protein
MHKALAIAAIATLAMGSEDLAAENELNFFKSIGNGLKKAGTFVIQHPKIITTAAKILAVDDEELFSLHNAIHKAEEGVKKAEKKAVEYVAQHPEVVREAIEILKNLKHDDEELFHLGKTLHNVAHAVGKVEHIAKDGLQVVKDVQTGNYVGAIQHGIKTVKDVKHDDEELFNIHNAIHHAEEGVKKAEHYVYDHRHQIENGAKKAVNYVAEHPEVVKKAIEILKNLKQQHDDEELFNLGKTIHNVAHAVGKVEHIAKDGLQVVKDVQTGNYIGAIQHGVQTVKDVKHHDDEELFSLGKTVHNVAHAVGKVEHVAKDGLNVYKDIQTGNYIGAIQHGVQTVKDAKKHDDEELFSLHNAIHKAEEGVKKAEHYVYDHRQQIADGAKKAVNYAHEHPEVVKQAIEILKSLKHHDDDELFNLGKTVHNVAHAVGKVEHIAKDGLNVYKDIQTGNYIGAIQHGVQTVKDVKHHDDEELFNLGNLIHDGMNIAKDIKTKNYGGLISHGIQTVKDVKKHDDEEFFSLGKAVHNVAHAVGKVEHIAKDGLQVVKDVQTGNYIGAIQHGVQTVKDAKKHDDEELFNLGTLINDGIHIAKDIKGKNYGGLVNDSIQTVKDVKEATHGKKFLRH